VIVHSVSVYLLLVYWESADQIKEGRMRKDYSGSPKLHQSEFKKKRLTWILGVAGLCTLFYFLGAWQNTLPPPSEASRLRKANVSCSSLSPIVSSSSVSLDFESHHAVGGNETSKDSINFESCDIKYSEYTPCQDPERARKFDRTKLIYRECHCPDKKEALKCLIPAPPGYKNPFRWPKSRDYAWFANVPHRA